MDRYLASRKLIAAALGDDLHRVWHRVRGVDGTGYYHLPFGGRERFLGANAREIVRDIRAARES